jgi:CRISPR-associated endonuclease/helicase Cas3
LKTNIHLLQRNVKSFINPQKPVFTRPGFETDDVKLDSKDLAEILEQHEWQFIDSRPRILEREALQPNQSLVDIEHHQLRLKMLPQKIRSGSPRRRANHATEQHSVPPPLGAHSWWTAPNATLLAILQHEQPFRKNDGQQDDLVLLPNAEEDDFVLHRIEKVKDFKGNSYIAIEESMLERLSDSCVQGLRINPWFIESYPALLINQAESEEMELERCAKKYGVLSLRSNKDSNRKWCFHAALGFFKAT